MLLLVLLLVLSLRRIRVFHLTWDHTLIHAHLFFAYLFTLVNVQSSVSQKKGTKFCLFYVILNKRLQGKRGVWIKLPIEFVNLVEATVQVIFLFLGSILFY